MRISFIYSQVYIHVTSIDNTRGIRSGISLKFEITAFIYIISYYNKSAVTNLFLAEDTIF